MLLCQDWRLTLGIGMPIYLGVLPAFPRLGTSSVSSRPFPCLSRPRCRIPQGKRGPGFASGCSLPAPRQPAANSAVAGAAQKYLWCHFRSERVMWSNLQAPQYNLLLSKVVGWLNNFPVRHFVFFFSFTLDTCFYFSSYIRSRIDHCLY